MVTQPMWSRQVAMGWICFEVVAFDRLFFGILPGVELIFAASFMLEMPGVTRRRYTSSPMIRVITRAAARRCLRRAVSGEIRLAVG